MEDKYNNLSIFIWNAYMQKRNVCSQKVFQ